MKGISNMYTPNNTPAGKFEEYTGTWRTLTIQEVSEILRRELGEDALAAYNEIVSAGVECRPGNARTKNIIRFTKFHR